jgi:hypothetical protein
MATGNVSDEQLAWLGIVFVRFSHSKPSKFTPASSPHDMKKPGG